MFCRESTWKTRTSLSPNLFQGLWCFVILNMTEYVYLVYRVSCCFIAFPYQMWFLFEQGQIPNSVGWKLPSLLQSFWSSSANENLHVSWVSTVIANQSSHFANHKSLKPESLHFQKKQQISINIPMFDAQIPIFPGKSWVNPSILAPLCGSPVGGSPVAPWCRPWIPCTPPNRCPTRWGWPHVMVYPTINMG